MSICDNYETTIGNLTLEASVYEDGYVTVSVVDEFGEEIDTLDGTAHEDNTEEIRVQIEETLIYKHFNN